MANSVGIKPHCAQNPLAFQRSPRMKSNISLLKFSLSRRSFSGGNSRCSKLRLQSTKVHNMESCSVQGDKDAFSKQQVHNEVESILQGIKWDEKGLVVAIAQHVHTGAILMQGFANKEAVVKTLLSGKATFYSRSRSCLWTKGETSSNYINVVDVFMDCDHDSLVYLGKPDGPSCHTGAENCYFTAASSLLKIPKDESKKFPLTTLYSLETTITQRKMDLVIGQEGRLSWTKKLLSDPKLLCSKIREEADELCRTLEENEEGSRAASEMADVIYHAMVLLAIKNVKMEQVLEILHKRFDQSGIEEKNSRK